MSNDGRLLPACQKCKIRKVRCDGAAPKCANCTRSNVACIIVDPVTGEQYARDYIRALEEQEAQLKASVGDRPVRAVDSATAPSEHAEISPRGPSTGGSVGLQGGFVGDGSGLGFLHSILSEAKWQQHRPRILNQLAARPRILKQHVSPNSLPSLQEAGQLLENYFTRFHIHHTFLLRQDVLSIFDRVYNAPAASKSPQDYFRLLMIFAISSTTRYRAGLSSEHPYGYFMAAETYLGEIPLIKNTEAIENLLLVARFGMYHHIGLSLWEISQLCMRQCIEWQLHAHPFRLLDPLTEQHHRRIFWECYVLDRYSSGILGRPFAISEGDIDVPLPVDMSDEDIIRTGATCLDTIPIVNAAAPTEVSVFIFCIKLRRISSRVHSTFYSGRSPASQGSTGGGKTADFKSIGHVYTAYSQLRKQLNEWRATAPLFQNPRSLYERSEWHDFLHEKDMLLLARGALHNVPSKINMAARVTKELLAACYHSASRVIQTYGDLMDKRAITWTRSYFQVIFTAGLTVAFCASLEMSKDGSEGIALQQNASETLNLCSNILDFFKEKMPDAGSFAVVFNVLKDECISDRSRGLQTRLLSQNLNQNQPVSMSIDHLVDPTLSTTNINMNHATTTADQMNLAPQNSLDHFDFENHDFGLGLTDNLMTQLEAGLGEYAWGSLPVDGNFWDQLYYD